MRSFRDQLIPAPLKPRLLRGRCTHRYEFPRSADPGPIEAPARPSPFLGKDKVASVEPCSSICHVRPGLRCRREARELFLFVYRVGSPHRCRRASRTSG